MKSLRIVFITALLASSLLAVPLALASGDAIGFTCARAQLVAAHRGEATSAQLTAARVTPRSLPTTRLIWSDEFSGPAGTRPDPQKWRIDTGGTGFGNRELEFYTARARNVALDGHGHLAITARREVYSGGGYTRHYTSGKIEGQGKFSVTYGSIQARIELPAGQGLWPAFWALGTDVDSVGWPQAGEIDVMENLGQRPFTAYGSIHGPSTCTPFVFGLTTAVKAPASLSRGFHVYGVNRSPDLVQLTLDGVPYATYTPSSLSPGEQWIFNKPFFLILNLAVGGTWPGAPNASTPFPARMLVDWVRVYSWSPPQ